MKIYIDTVILNRIEDGLWDLKEDSVSFKEILKLKTNFFWVSLKTKEEINNIKDEGHRKKVLDIYRSMKKISSPPSSSYSSGLVRFGSGFSTQDLDLTKLINLFYSPSPYYKKKTLSVVQNKKGKMILNDVFHIYYAWKGSCDYFLTLDRKLIRKYHNPKIKHEVDRIVSPMKIVDPQTLLNLLISARFYI